MFLLLNFEMIWELSMKGEVEKNDIAKSFEHIQLRQISSSWRMSRWIEASLKEPNSSKLSQIVRLLKY